MVKWAECLEANEVDPLFEFKSGFTSYDLGLELHLTVKYNASPKS